jgi:hypothetical protein
LNTHLLYQVEVVVEGGDYSEYICASMSSAYSGKLRLLGGLGNNSS